MKKSSLLILALIVGGVVMRLWPHAPNVTPLLAVALFSGQFLKNKQWAFLAPLLIVAATDLFLGFHSTAWAVYLSLGACVAMGRSVGQKSPEKEGPGLAPLLGGPVLFFVVTNFAVWLQSGMYAFNLSGLGACYAAAIPFFHNTLLSTAGYSAVLYGARWVVKRWRPQWVESPSH